MYLLEGTRQRGVHFDTACVTGVDVVNGRVNGVRLISGARIDTPIFINAAGPFLKDVGRLLGVELPVYYTKTRKNRPLVGPMGVDGAYVIGGLSGHGIMSACGAGELLAAHVTGEALPSYAPAFALSRYEDGEYMKQLEGWSENGQL